VNRIWLLLACLVMPLFASAEKIVLANGEWAPYLSENLKHHGYISRIVKEAFAEEGYEVEYVFLPWKRGFEDAKDGTYHGSIVWGYNDERANDFEFSDTVVELGTSLFYNKNKPIDWEKLTDLTKYKIGGVIGYAYGIEEMEAAGEIEIIRIGKDEGNYKKLDAGRLDIVLEDTEVGLETISRMGLKEQLIPHPKTMSPRTYHVIVSKQLANRLDILDAFNRGLQKLRADGRFDKYVSESRAGLYKQ